MAQRELQRQTAPIAPISATRPPWFRLNLRRTLVEPAINRNRAKRPSFQPVAKWSEVGTLLHGALEREGHSEVTRDIRRFLVQMDPPRIVTWSKSSWTAWPSEKGNITSRGPYSHVLQAVFLAGIAARAKTQRTARRAWTSVSANPSFDRHSSRVSHETFYGHGERPAVACQDYRSRLIQPDFQHQPRGRHVSHATRTAAAYRLCPV